MSKLTQAEVHYTPNAAKASERCGLCEHFRPLYAGCALVEAKPKAIVKGGWCRKFKRKATEIVDIHSGGKARSRRRNRIARQHQQIRG